MRTLLIPPLIAVLLALEPDGCVKILRSSTLRPVWLQRETQTLTKPLTEDSSVNLFLERCHGQRYNNLILQVVVGKVYEYLPENDVL
jgi:hypothetical protein